MASMPAGGCFTKLEFLILNQDFPLHARSNSKPRRRRLSATDSRWACPTAVARRGDARMLQTYLRLDATKRMVKAMISRQELFDEHDKLMATHRVEMERKQRAEQAGQVTASDELSERLGALETRLHALEQSVAQGEAAMTAAVGRVMAEFRAALRTEITASA